MASEQRKIERVIPKIGIVTKLCESRGTTPFFPRRQELRFNRRYRSKATHSWPHEGGSLSVRTRVEGT